MKIKEDFVEGIFIKESKNRFICTVLIESKPHECYVASASKLKNYLNMNGKKVLLVKINKIESKMKYRLFAVEYYNQYIILDLLFVNRILEEYLKAKYFEDVIKREGCFEGYKSDFLILGNSNIVVEAKGIIAMKKNIKFPTVFSKRAIDQLHHILKFLKDGIKVHYYLISLSPIVKSIKINDELMFKEYTDLLMQCINEGMVLSGFNIILRDNEVKINKKLKMVDSNNYIIF